MFIVAHSVIDGSWLTVELAGTPPALRRRKSVESPADNNPSLAGGK
jgi:hypothetical protein